MVIYIEEKEEVKFGIFKNDVKKAGKSIVLKESETALTLKK